MATYKQIQEYIKSKHGFAVKTCWIADMKEMCRLPKMIARNRINLKSKVQPCPEDKRDVIFDAFRHYEMIE